MQVRARVKVARESEKVKSVLAKITIHAARGITPQKKRLASRVVRIIHRTRLLRNPVPKSAKPSSSIRHAVTANNRCPLFGQKALQAPFNCKPHECAAMVDLQLGVDALDVIANCVF